MLTQSSPGVSLHTALSEEERALVERGLMAHARTLGIDASETERIGLCLRSATGSFVGGVVAVVMWGWLEVRMLWVHEAHRSRGHGMTLLTAAEHEAMRRCCHHARLETYDPTAHRFYQRRGYEQYAVVPDYPTGHTRWLLKKALTPGTPAGYTGKRLYVTPTGTGATVDAFIEVTGTASAHEQVSEYRAELSLTVRAAQGETAVAQVGELRDRCVRALRDAGLRDDELKEGGAAVWRPWFWKKEPGREATQRILLSSNDASRLFRALQAVEPLLDNKRFSLSVNMLRPKFDLSPAARREAQVAAIADARAQAEVLAQAARLRVAGVLQIEELDQRKTRTGAYGDEDWGGVYAVAAAGAPAAGAAEPEALDPAVRETRYRYRVRFAVEQVSAG